jgi:predicted DNA binding CopG/RHH family protein
MAKIIKDKFNINVRVSEQQLKDIKAQADKELLSMSGYIRRAVFVAKTVTI